MAETKYIFVTGGVVSSLGKGIISSSIGKLLQARGYNITIQKFDPYINIDPGTLNPYEHGECYVTVDGMETDLDLGHYERFTGIQTTKANSMTTGRIYKSVIDKERRGDYLGKTIQVVPHITDEIKRNIKQLGQKYHYDFVITEIGGTIGDIESAPFMEAIRQMKWELGDRAINVHLTYVPYLHAAGELKTKPTQHSVKELQSVGIQPDVLVLRTEKHLDEGIRKKVANFCNVDFDCVVQSEDLPSIYEVPVAMQNQGLDEAILRKCHEPIGERPALGPWKSFLDRRAKATEEVHIGLVGKYDLQDAYKSIREALLQAGTYNDRKTVLTFINSEEITEENVGEMLKGQDGIVVCPGFGQRGIEGKVIAAHYSRTHDIPTFGICLGMQMMNTYFLVAEEAQRRGWSGTLLALFDQMKKERYMFTEPVDGHWNGHITRDAVDSFKHPIRVEPGSRIEHLLGGPEILGASMHNYRITHPAAALRVTGRTADGTIEALEYGDQMLGVQFHPEADATSDALFQMICR